MAKEEGNGRGAGGVEKGEGGEQEGGESGKKGREEEEWMHGEWEEGRRKPKGRELGGGGVVGIGGKKSG